MIRRPPRSTRTDTLFPTRRSSDLPLAGQMAMLLNQQQARGVRKLATSTPLFFRFKSKGVINTTTLNITNNISLKNIFSYRKFDISRGFDLDGTTLQILAVINPLDRKRTRLNSSH